jgi:DNA-binding NarL/FixJ family response regulator
MGCPGQVVPPRIELGTVEPPPSTSKSIRVLVVDDDSRVRTAIGRTIALEPDLIEVSHAGATAGAVEAEHAGPLVALVDLGLAETDKGLSLVRELTRRIGCVVVAMSISGVLREAALEAGASFFVEKDGDIDAVLDAVRAGSGLSR